MKSANDKQLQKQLKQLVKAQQNETFVSSLPISVSEFKSLFDYVDDKLENESCDDTLRFTEEYLTVHHLLVNDVIIWLNNQDGYCDCEVLANVEEKFNSL